MSRFSCSDGLAGKVVRAGELRFAFSARGKRSKENEKKRMIKIKKNAE